ncbi:NAD-dependent epimerase/dehydratase family protein [Microbulbifer celer]|uniref:NAD-dependent epimerase/dehydratase family protein n=1 Tax=Microbulbifer celer TaxID=435905 RepID=A0ABW3U860_9GAMM|nr:NAD-dependent epimerase/dehydratase family protein [Microbulbifer celer]UFN57098.1 NAD-dependent epimerase/dehydratase family protein [Microbulbifer celer]
MAKEKVWIFGCGDLGTRLALKLDRKAYDVFGVRRNPLQALARKRRADVVNWRRGDATRPEDVQNHLAKGADIVIATFTPGVNTPQAYQRAYVETAKVLSDAIAQMPKPPRLFLWISSSRVYGQSGDQWLNEKTQPLPNSYQGEALLAAEKIAQTAPAETSVIRFAGIYGPGRDRLLSQVRAGRCAPPSPPQYSNRIHVDDATGFMVHLIEGQKNGMAPEKLYIGADCTPVPMYELQSWLAKSMGYTNAHLREEVATSERRSKRLSNQRMLDSGYEMLYPNYRLGYSTLLENE